MAQLVEQDWMGEGDGLITYDPDTGLQWLDLTETQEYALADVLEELGEGGEYEGFRLATAAEVATLFAHAGLPASDVENECDDDGYSQLDDETCGTDDTDDVAAANVLLGLWGITRTTSDCECYDSTARGFVDDLNDDSEPVHFYAELRAHNESIESIYDWDAGTKADDEDSADDVGAALVRSVEEMVSATSARDVPTPTGEDVPVIDIDVFEEVASNVVVAGETDADFCVAPDPRERLGNSKGKAKGRGPTIFNPRDVALTELAGTGTCTGDLEFPDEDYDTWEDLLSVIDLRIPRRYRGFLGDFTLPGDEDPTRAVWLVVGVVRTSAEFDGPIAVIGYPEELIDYDNLPSSVEEPACNNTPDWRNFDLGGTVEAFGEIPNPEGPEMIFETAQCNRAASLTRRTTHVFPLRLDGPGNSTGRERENILVQFDGIQATLGEAASCADSSLISVMQGSLSAARSAFAAGAYGAAVEDLEDIAIAAHDAEDYGDGFDDCDVETNYRGNFVSRALAGAFTVHDRFLHADSYVKYWIPSEVADIVPLLDPESL